MAKISMRDLARVVDFLDEFNDPRRTEYGNIRHKLDFFKQFLELPNGIPDESVYRRVLQYINPYHLKGGLRPHGGKRVIKIRGGNRCSGA